ncbi:hypothetical protein Dsin_001665 [Dipteronia sinensis]|uniref:Neuronal PAS domain protein n=1 Tax=Dipteronia sinensis TaxID=43782 RepID=A0AAE0B5U3_9ROSI|nr:hypothetical protein Dsin_001665 [Dipteronia sinensis]
MASSSCFPDTFDWIQNLPTISQWKTNYMSICICSSSSIQPSLNLSVAKNLKSSTFSFSIFADFTVPISLWASKPFKINPKSAKLLDEDAISNFLFNLIEDVLKYGSNTNNGSMIRFLKLDYVSNLKDIFNLAFLTLSLLICIYEAPVDLRSGCLNTLKNRLITCSSRQASKVLMKHLGSNLEEQWMRSLNLAITNWIVELQSAAQRTLKTPSPLFSYAIATSGLWKVQLYCPVIAMEIESSSNVSTDERLLFALDYHQLEGVIQFNYKLVIQEKWINLTLNTDNIRCDVVRLINETLMNERGVGVDEKHFPSRISLHLTPTQQTNIISVSVGKSSDNPSREFEMEKTIEGSFDPPNSFLSLKVSAGESSTISLKPWKYEQSVYGYSAILNWFLHDSMDGREVFSSKPSKFALMNPKAWFKDRYSSAYRPFTRQGGVIFAGDEYGERVWWKIDKAALGRTMEWEIRGWIWLTYWPNKHRTFYNETRRLEFKEVLHVNLT